MRTDDGLFSGVYLTLVSRPLSRPIILTLHHKSLMCNSPSSLAQTLYISIFKGFRLYLSELPFFPDGTQILQSDKRKASESSARAATIYSRCG